MFCFPCCQCHVEGLEEIGIQTIQTYHNKSSRLACPEMVAYEKCREDGSVATKLSDAHKAHVSQNYYNLRQRKTSR